MTPSVTPEDLSDLEGKIAALLNAHASETHQIELRVGCAYLAALYAQWRLAATEPPHTPFDDARADVPLLSGAKEE